MNVHFAYTVASRDFYAPLETADDDSTVLTPSTVPDGWRSERSGLWTLWRPDGAVLAEAGWKVHVSAPPNRLAAILDTVAGAAFDRGVLFKHAASEFCYFWTHNKYASRAQGGKFIALYPADVDAARDLMEHLRTALAEEDGPYILSDRRYRDSRTVHYRYGAYLPVSRLNADGTTTLLVPDGHGRHVPDRREARFTLPEGIEDPFVEPTSTTATASASAANDLHGFAVRSSVRYTNAGGTYRGVEIATGRKVFLKEGRPFTGLRGDGASATVQLREEWDTLTALHALVPGLAPEPIAYFTDSGHEFMVTQHVDGTLLNRWVAANHPATRAGASRADFTAFHTRCERILAQVEGFLAALHAVGYVFVDISPGNIVIGPDDAARLIDFGSARRLDGPFLATGTPGFTPPDDLVGDDLTVYDHYGVGGLARLMLAPLNQVVEEYPGTLVHLRADLAETAPPPTPLWERATRYHRAELAPGEPTPEQIAADPQKHLAILRDRTADALLAMADLDDPLRMFPTIPQGYAGNTLGVAYGTAGVVHALHHAGRPIPDAVLQRLRTEALAQAEALPPGLFIGTAGIACVLAESGLANEAETLLEAADRHRLVSESATLFGGASGLVLAHLTLYGHTGDERHVDRALSAAAHIRTEPDLTTQLGVNDAAGLLHGRCGVALALQQLAGVTGEQSALTRAVELLHAELDRVIDADAPGLLFPVSAKDRRAMPYLSAGSAGMVFSTARVLRSTHDERLAEALPRMLAPLRLTATALAGLFQGVAGYSLVLADHALLTGDKETQQAASRTARSLYKFATPHPTGVRFLGDQLLRYSAELWSGSAGVLLALSQVLDPRPDVLFTVDSLIERERGAAAPGVPALAGAGR